MAMLKLHRCSWTFVHTDRDPCWKVQRALDEMGMEYELVKHGYSRSRRDDVEALSGQRRLPVLELENGEIYRAESDEMAARVRAGSLATGSHDVARTD